MNEYQTRLGRGGAPLPPSEPAFFHIAGTGRDRLPEALARSELVQRSVRYGLCALLAGLVGVLLLVATATVPVLFGYHTYIVRGGSMEPALSEGSVAVTHPTSPRALATGDIIAYRSTPGSPPVLHRIVAVTYEEGEPRFTTQGDQNRTPDAEPVALADPGDKVVYSVPYAGYILSFARSGLGMALLIGGPLVTLAALFLGNAPGSQRQERGIGTEVATVERQASPALQLVFAADPQPVARSPSAQPAPRDLPTFLVQQLRLYRGEDLAGIAARPQGERVAA